MEVSISLLRIAAGAILRRTSPALRTPIGLLRMLVQNPRAEPTSVAFLGQ